MPLQVQALSIVDAVAQDLRDKLFGGGIAIDAQLTESNVASTYGIARPTARAAVERLVSEGLLVRGSHKSARVPAMGPDDVRDLYLARTLIESEVVRRLALERKLPPGLQQSNRDMLTASDESGIAAIEPVTRFHLLLVRSLGSPRIDRLFSILMGDMRLCMVQMESRHLLSPTSIAEEHDQIVDAIQDGDPVVAVAAMVEHLQRAEGRLVPRLRSEAGGVQRSSP